MNGTESLGWAPGLLALRGMVEGVPAMVAAIPEFMSAVDPPPAPPAARGPWQSAESARLCCDWLWTYSLLVSVALIVVLLQPKPRPERDRAPRADPMKPPASAWGQDLGFAELERWPSQETDPSSQRDALEVTRSSDPGPASTQVIEMDKTEVLTVFTDGRWAVSAVGQARREAGPALPWEFDLEIDLLAEAGAGRRRRRRVAHRKSIAVPGLRSSLGRGETVLPRASFGNIAGQLARIHDPALTDLRIRWRRINSPPTAQG